ncbi:MAG: gliding motility-associated C-terminal domain-containing protein [Bacteroidetes bacterium]|nr:MAG: gliding motility-associated C-terminal domain-containing protein [Bacteroidota bacterium]
MELATQSRSFLLRSFVTVSIFFLVQPLRAQIVEMFNYTGGQQQWVVPNCVNTISVVVAGAEGGGNLGGDGAVITSIIPVVPGQVIDINVGGQGGPGTPGYGGGGTGHLSMDGNPAYASFGGGGATTLSIGGQPFIIAAGGGGTGGGSDPVAGGNGGCATGSLGISTWGLGGGGATQVAGGAGGVPWNATPPGGQAGMLGQGGFGGPWNTASGGGGGGGFYGGGGGGNDGCCTGANGGGGGGGGSSLVPMGSACNSGTNTGNGFVSITYVNAAAPTASNSGEYCTGETIELFLDITAGNGEFLWNGPNGFSSTDQNPTIQNCTAAMEGIYTVMITGDNGCADTLYASTEVIINESPQMDPIADRALCNGAIVNIGNFSASSQTTTYSWTNSLNGIGLGVAGNGNIQPFIGTAGINDQTGTIIVTPTDNGCVGIADTFLITIYKDPNLSVSNDTIICQNGTANLVAQVMNSTNETFVYQWNHTTDTLGIQVVNPAVSSTYSVYAENQNGCFSDTLTIEVILRDPLSGNLNGVDTICPYADVNLTANVLGGLGNPYSFTWSNGEIYVGNAVSMINVSPDGSQNYTVTISDGCESTPLVLTKNIYVSPLPTPSFTVLNPEQCEPAIFSIVNTTDPALSSNVTWIVNGIDQYIDQDTITTNQFWGGQYDVQMIITSFEGCVDSLHLEDVLNVRFKPEADFKYSPSPVTMFNTEVFFQNYSTNADLYQWNFENGNPGYSEQTDVTVQFPEGVQGQYDVMLIAISELGCSDTAIHTVIVLPEVLIYVPNAFTPDADEFNQTWNVYAEGVDLHDFELNVYNRWGELIWQSKDIRTGWDGTYNGSIVQSGMYVWKMQYSTLYNAEKQVKTGHVTLIK